MSEVKLAPSERVLEFLGGVLTWPAAAFRASLSLEEGGASGYRKEGGKRVGSRGLKLTQEKQWIFSADEQGDRKWA